MTDTKRHRPFHPNGLINYIMEGSAWAILDMTPDKTVAHYLQEQIDIRKASQPVEPPRRPLVARALKKLGL